MFEEKVVQKDGRSWSVEKTFKTFESADKLRNEINKSEEKEAKVKVSGNYPNYRYNVKVRLTQEEFDKNKKK